MIDTSVGRAGVVDREPPAFRRNPIARTRSALVPYRYRAPHAFISSQGAGSQTSRSSSLVKITGASVAQQHYDVFGLL
jgi:hypothetical protein